MNSELISKWEPTGMLDDVTTSSYEEEMGLAWSRPVLTDGEKLELSTHLEEGIEILKSRDEVPSTLGGDRKIGECPSILFLPIITRLYRDKGVTINTNHIFFEMNKKWNNMRESLKELAVIPTIDFEAEFVAIFCENYNPATTLDPNKIITKLVFI